jgi:hypothetical protein
MSQSTAAVSAPTFATHLTRDQVMIMENLYELLLPNLTSIIRFCIVVCLAAGNRRGSNTRNPMYITQARIRFRGVGNKLRHFKTPGIN